MQVSLTLEGCNSAEPALISKKISSGKFNVYHAKFIAREVEGALKVFPKNSFTKKMYFHEKQMLSKLKHPNIISHIAIQNHNLDCDIILTEYAPYGDFLGLVVKGLLTTDKQIRTYFHHLIEALEYIHSKGIAHLDLKLENCLLDKHFQLKVADFDQAQSLQENELISGGTTNYRAPEIINKDYKSFPPIDIYAAGVMLFALKTGEFPFLEGEVDHGNGDHNEKLFYDRNQLFWERKAKHKENKEFFESSFIKLINGMLEKDPKKRFTIHEIKRSEWYNGAIYDVKSLKIEMERLFERNFKNFTKVRSMTQV